MISDSFDMESEAIITPSSFLGEKGKICDIAIATFSREIFPAVLKLFENEKIGEMKAANRIKPVYLLDVNNLKRQQRGNMLFHTKHIEMRECLTIMHLRKIIYKLKMRRLWKIFLVWTTDAIYRETRNLVEKRKSEGCIAVEMELAGMQAVCDFYNIELYDFLVTGDIVDQLEYTSEGLHDANHNLDKFYVALKIAEMINKG